jgi:plasmid stabilization system protein ParE
VKQTIVTDRAIYDIEKAKKWYEKQQENLGNKFADYVFKCFGEIQKNPLAYPSKYKYVREMYIRKYPYLIIYSVEEKVIFILRIFPCKTNPKKKYKK